jgi:preprotein translocase subunit SecG
MELSDYLSVAAILVSIALVAIILLQVKGEGVGGLQSGSFVRTRRGLEKTLFQLTIGLSVLWLVIAALAVIERR